MTILLYDAAPPPSDVGNQVLSLVQDNVTDLGMYSVPPSNHLYEIYRWTLTVEVGEYMRRIGRVPTEPVQLLVAFDDEDPAHVTGFVLFSAVPTHAEACGVHYMAVKQSHRRRGIGREILKRVVAKYPHTELTCTVKKVPFYESVGFQVLDTHNTQVVMNTRSASTEGLMATLNVAPIFESADANAIRTQLHQRWGSKEMKKAHKQLLRHIDLLARESEAFVKARISPSVGKEPHP